MPGRDRHTKEPRFDHKKYLNQSVRTDSWVDHTGATIPNIIMNKSVGSSVFNPNMYNGGGTKWWKNQYDKWNFTTDNLTVRGTMWIWELLINQLRASNGTVIISSCAKVSESGASLNSGVSWDLIFDSNSETANLQPFAVDDIIMAKRFTMPNDGSNPSTLIEVVGTVTAISVGGNHARITVDIDGGYSTPEGGLEFVRIGNTTDTSRQGSIVLTSDGIDSGGSATVPYIDVYDGIDARSKFLDKDYVKARLGRLDEITGNTDEYGLWTNNLYLQGSSQNAGMSFTYWETSNPPSGAQAGYNNGDTWYNEVTGIIWKYVSAFGLTGLWYPSGSYQDETGNFFNAEAPSGDGFYAGSGHFGLYLDSKWQIYFDSDGDVHFGEDESDVFLYDNSANKVIIGAAGLSGQRIEFIGSDGEMAFYDSGGTQRISFDSSVGHGSRAGISVIDGTIFASCVSNSQHGAFQTTRASIDNTKNQIGYKANFNTAASISAWTAGTVVVGFDSYLDVDGGSLDVYGINAVADGTTSGIKYGGKFWGKNFGVHATSAGYAGYFDGKLLTTGTLYIGSSSTSFYEDSANIIRTADNFICDGDMFINATSGSGALNFGTGTTIGYGIQFGSDVQLYRSASNVLYTPDAFTAAGIVRTNTSFNVSGSAGLTTTVVAGTNTIHVTGGIITAIVAI